MAEINLILTGALLDGSSYFGGDVGSPPWIVPITSSDKIAVVFTTWVTFEFKKKELGTRYSYDIIRYGGGRRSILTHCRDTNLSIRDDGISNILGKRDPYCK